MSIYEKQFKKIEDPGEDDGQKVIAIEHLTSSGKERRPSGRRLAEEFAPRFEQMLKSESPKVRSALVKALGSFAIKFYASSIIHLLDDPNAEVRGTVIWALDQMDARRYRPKIEEIKSDSSQLILRDENFRMRELTVGELAKEVLEKWDFIEKKKDDF